MQTPCFRPIVASWKSWPRIKALLLGGLFVVLAALDRAEAVENLAGGTFNTTAPTAADIPNWGTGWPGSGLTGWNYVGTINGASGVYLGNSWVITAGHVGPGTFTLGGVPYTMVGGSAHSFSNINGTADISVFQIASPPSLPSLTIATSAPTPLSAANNGSAVAIIGYGGGPQSWGLNTVTANNMVVEVASGITYDSIDFETAYGTTTAGTRSATNNYGLVVGDSGGGDFIFKSSTSKWLLAGLNEAIDNAHNSYFVQLSSYAAQITPVISGPSAPGINTVAATAITQTGATVNGLINAENFSTTVSFDYGLTTGYGSNVAGTPTPVTGTSQVAVSATLSGLTPGTTYHFRVNGVNANGTSNGADLTFTTLTPLQAWRQTYYGTTNNTGNAADTADPYGTGVANLPAFAFFGPNQNPTQTRISQLPQAQRSGGNLFFSFTQPSGVSGITYGAQWSTTLQAGDWNAISDTGSGSQHIFSIATGSNAELFIRLTVSDP